MLEQFISYGIGLYFLGLIISGLSAFLDKNLKASSFVFVFSNIVGFVSSILYFLFFFGQKITLSHFDWLLEFAPQLNFFSAIFFVLTSGISALVGIYSLRYLALYKESYSPNLVHFLMSFFVLGMQGVLLANNSFAFLFFWELMSITSFFLVLSDKTKESVKAAFLYFIMTHLGALAILGGFLILGNGSILFSLSDIKTASQGLSSSSLILAFSLFIFGFGSKAGLVPFHVWLPEAHPQAPSNISALMSGLMLKIAVYGFIFVMLGFNSLPKEIGIVVLFLGLLSGVVGVLYATTERDIKKSLAYSSIENMGIIFTMLGLAIYFLGIENYREAAYSIIGFAIFHAISHALFKTALFLSSGIVINRVHTKSLDKMGGIAKTMPIFAGAFLLATISSLPLPPFGTFYGEWGLIQNILSSLHQAETTSISAMLLLIVLAAIGLISGLAIFAMVKIFSISMLGLPRNKHMEDRAEKMDFLLIMPVLILGVGVFLLGLLATSILPAIIEQLRNFSQIENVTLYPYFNFSSWQIGIAIVLVVLVIYIINRWFLNNQKEREYQTWDCGQPIDETMQYTATAFSAPIRFFFLTFIGRKKNIQTESIVATNPWIKKYSFYLSIRSVWSDFLYAPIGKFLFATAEKIRFIQNGRIQYYILLLLFALIFTLIFAL